ncbi:hypothetical protein CHS0354_019951 [Potamilus streckersoni]|uniref:Somatomedin-B and thrombospondin type-1 domain-containing protein n=1 Tax=Potamilus streckersoni TaxID=2493646 RepID=A0AAE0VM29_9BIVA|nr:hypothetical protein CHS0354_019951 [Potamilus streckersoni]
MKGTVLSGIFGILVLSLSAVQIDANFRTCREARLCCEGRNNTCFVFGPRVDRAEEADRCFCDENCKTMGDCCIDVDEYCQGIDCVLDDWGPWSECNNPCGLGLQHRKRGVLTQPKFGGSHCSKRKQKRVCVGNQGCKQLSVEYQGEELQEIGRIIPVKYSVYRTSSEYSPLFDIRKNLFARQGNEILKRPAYSATFKITMAKKACQTTNSTWANVLEEGAEVCVECQPGVMMRDSLRCKGHGVYLKETAWSAETVPHCRGEWKMITKHDETKTCNLQGDHDFVLI